MKFIVFFLLLLFTSLFAEEKVVLQLKWLHQFQFAGYYAAYEKGFYKEVGLDVEIRERDLDKNNIAQVINGEADYSVADAVLFLYKAKNEPIVVIAPIFQHSPNMLMTLKESGLDSPYKLENKDVTFYRKDVDGFGILGMFKSLKVEPVFSRIKEKTNYTHLAEKKTDAYTVYVSNEPFYMKQIGVDVNLINPANYGFDLYGDMLFTSTKEAKEHPERVQKFKEASLKGWLYALEHKHEIVALIKNKYAKEKSLEHLRYEADALEQMIQHKAIPIGTLDLGRVQYTLDLFAKYGLIENSVPIEEYIFNPTEKSQEKKNLLNAEEKAYLKEKKVLKMCIDPDWMPFEQHLNGKHIGMSAEYIKIIEELIQTPIEMVSTHTWSESLAFGKEKKCDFFSLMMPTDERRQYLSFTQPYLRVPLVIVTDSSELFVEDISKVKDKKIGIVKGYAFGEILLHKYPDMQIVDVKNIKDGLEKVYNKELFGFIDTLATTGYHIQKEYIGQLKIAGKFDETWNLGIGARNDEPLLKDIFEKAIAEISQEQKQEILNKWVSVNYDKEANNTFIFRWFMGILLVFSIVLSVVLFVNRRLAKEIQSRKIIEKKLEEMSITDALTSLYNRRYFNEMLPRLINSAKRDNTTICFAILDIDYFKQYNDTYGHIGGDEVLKRISQVLRDSMQRADDYSFRLGGEEFGILFKGVDATTAQRFINEIREKIESLHLEHKTSSVCPYLTASLGLVVKDAQQVQKCEDLYREADELLYKAKAGGRNRVESHLLLL
ncbi:MAG: diguanylate cyclase [Sulfurimonas sp.]|nr:diguanylate cyclase [Sulfurimonas sp.]MDD3060200.1 diguanylate cyclase [Sulfurimonas sp.]MDD5202135.1 diguanylate cyclase [Sulfurimonas sp.]